jgi:[histone H3]-lysine9 N-dimethyltransferase
MENSEGEAENEDQFLERKPLRSLAPMLPAPLGPDVEVPSLDPMFVFVTPFRPCSSSERPRQSSAPMKMRQSSVPLKATPISVVFPAPRHEDETSDEDYKPFPNQKNPASLKATKRARKVGDSDAGSIKCRPVRRSLNKDLVSCPSTSDGRNESAEVIMMMFDSLRRRILQLNEKEDASGRADLKAGTLMMQNGLRINNMKIIGPVPGVEIGDIFFFRIEMCIVGLHAPAMAGIDYISAKHVGKDETLAVSIISSGGYEHEDNDTDVLVYTGQGGNSRHKEKHDQRLERGNLALINSMKRKNLIRVVRSAKDPFCRSGQIYIYDGLYRAEASWVDKAKNGFNVFKYRLRREAGQPDGVSVWKMTEKWKQNPVTRDKVVLHDLSSNAENLPVCLVSDADDVEAPCYFNYITGVKYSRPLSNMNPLQCCDCSSVCVPGGTNCSCVQLNGGDVPYSSSGLLVKHAPILYECSSNCRCSQRCRNRVSQKGAYLKFEVFWTGDRGWGLRSWDPIRASTFVCEYAGEAIDEIHMNMDDKEHEYAFRTSWVGGEVSRWNMGAELLEEASGDVATESLKKSPIIISAKDSGNVARFLNHSCSPNLLWQPVQYGSYPHIMFFAMKHIPPMTELTYDYGTRGAPPGIKGEFPHACRLKPCLCGSTDCRGSF